MKEIKGKKEVLLAMSIAIIALLLIIGSTSYAFFTARIGSKNEENKTTTLTTSTLVDVKLDYGNIVSSNGMLPGHKVVKTITVKGDGNEKATPVPIEITLTPHIKEFENHVKYSIYGVENSKVEIESICGTGNKISEEGKYYETMECDTSELGSIIKEGTFIDEQVERIKTNVTYETNRTYYILIEYVNDPEKEQNSEQGKEFTIEIGYEGEGSKYKESLLNGADPVLADNLIPIKIDDTGKVTKANTSEEWYSYENKRWANAVILNDETKTYQEGEEIPESEIESYFVWIPKYSYKLWDLGEYNGLTSIDESKVHEIPIKFGLNNTSDAKEGECTTPGISGESGNCKIGDYMTPPAFLAFGTNGLWVGKFESGYKGATSTTSAEVNSAESTKLQIKPNVYSWRNIQVANAHQVSYNYKRELDSHMMKNTEWGAVVYLQHSAYGSAESVRINNNSSYITGYASVKEPTCQYAGTNEACNRYETTSLGADGSYTINYFNPDSQVASTTGNYTGIYDMSGGTWEYMMGVMLDSTNTTPLSGLNTTYNSGFNGPFSEGGSLRNGIDLPESKYYDTYQYGISETIYSRRILGDATGEMGPFGKENSGDLVSPISSWHKDGAWYVYETLPWFVRSADYSYGAGTGIFSLGRLEGSVSISGGFRIVLSIK